MSDLGLLILRLYLGLAMMLAHGMPKLLGFSEKVGQFADPLGLGSATSLSLAIFAEVICSGLLVLGLFSRLALIPLMITMATAFFVIHGADPFQKKELALMFLISYMALFLTGPGRYSVQEFFKIQAGRLNWLLK